MNRMCNAIVQRLIST